MPAVFPARFGSHQPWGVFAFFRRPHSRPLLALALGWQSLLPCPLPIACLLQRACFLPFSLRPLSGSACLASGQHANLAGSGSLGFLPPPVGVPSRLSLRSLLLLLPASASRVTLPAIYGWPVSWLTPFACFPARHWHTLFARFLAVIARSRRLPSRAGLPLSLLPSPASRGRLAWPGSASLSRWQSFPWPTCLARRVTIGAVAFLIQLSLAGLLLGFR